MYELAGSSDEKACYCEGRSSFAKSKEKKPAEASEPEEAETPKPAKAQGGGEGIPVEACRGRNSRKGRACKGFRCNR